MANNNNPVPANSVAKIIDNVNVFKMQEFRGCYSKPLLMFTLSLNKWQTYEPFQAIEAMNDNGERIATFRLALAWKDFELTPQHPIFEDRGRSIFIRTDESIEGLKDLTMSLSLDVCNDPVADIYCAPKARKGFKFLGVHIGPEHGDTSSRRVPIKLLPIGRLNPYNYDARTLKDHM